MKAVVLAAGKGTRLQPLTHTRPKVMIPIAGKPILAHVLDALHHANVHDVTIVVKYLKENILSYFGSTYRGMNISYVEQIDTPGTGAALLSAAGVNDDVLVVAGDILIDTADIMGAVKCFKETGTSVIGVTPPPAGDVSSYGIVVTRHNHVVDIIEKPSHYEGKPLINTSLYVFSSSIFSILSHTKRSPRGELELTTAALTLAQTHGLTPYTLTGHWLDMGMPWHLLSANEVLLSKMSPSVHPSAEIENSILKGPVIVEKNSRIVSSYIEGPVYIGENVEIGPHAYIRPSTSIGNDCCIGDSTTIKNSILLERVNAKHLSYIGDSIIGADCNFGAGTQIANYRFDEKPVKATVQGTVHNTLKKKLGTVIGDNTKTGVLSCVMPGKMIGDNCWIGAGTIVNQDIDRNTRVFVKQELVFSKNAPRSTDE